ncbi:MAG: type II toxin-antitoxin system RelE/ParE family toxin [Candidatus Nealsonbacteria bacterium]|nr:type II toxin-antitoxin system RelE/ParE family toxin [Candidatus Nealsonbacteria bacterium]
MPKWSLVFTLEARDDFKKLSESLQKRISDRLNWLQNSFDGIIPSALTGEWRGFFKLRVGDWRVIYKVEWGKSLIIVYIIDRRDKIYKKR